MSKYPIDWRTIEDNYDVCLDDIDDVLKDECEKVIDLRRSSPTFFAMEVQKNLNIPTTYNPNTVASSIFGCDREYGDGDNGCNPMCIKDTCRKSIWQMNCDGTDIKCIHDIHSSTVHVYAPSSVKDPVKMLKGHPTILKRLKSQRVNTVEIYRMAYSMMRFVGSYSLDEIMMKDRMCDRSDRLHGSTKNHENVDPYVKLRNTANNAIIFIVLLMFVFIIIGLIAYLWRDNIKAASLYDSSWLKTFMYWR